MSRRLPTLISVILTIGLGVISGSPWFNAFVNLEGGPTIVMAVVAAAVLSVAVPAVIGGVLGRRLPLSLPASVVAYVLAALVVAVTPIFSVASLGDGLTSALARMLQSTPPLVVTAGTLIPAFTLVWITGAVTGELLVRTKMALGLVVAPLIGFGLAFASTAQLERDSGFSSRSVLWAFVALAVTGMLIVVRRMVLDASTVSADAAAEREVATRSPVLAVLLLVLAGLLALLVVPRLPGTTDEPSAIDREPPVDAPVPDSPVDVFANYRRPDGLVQPSVIDETLLRVEIDQPSNGYLTVANLDDYDGGAWRFDRLFTPTGFEVPGDPGITDETIDQRYEILETLPFAEQWLPAIDRPVAVPPFDVNVDGDSFTVQAVYDEPTGMVVSPSPVGPGTTYSVTSRSTSSTLDDVSLQTPVASANVSAPAATTALVTDPNRVLDTWEARIAEDADTVLVGDVESLVTLRDWMRERLAVTPDDLEAKLAAQGGRADPVIRSLALVAMNAKLLEGDGQGTPEQIATIYVMLARRLGVPARLATGFRLVDESARDEGIDAGTYEVTGADAWTWAELLIGDEGWVVVDPTPPKDQVVPPSTTTTLPEGSKQEEDKPNEDLTAILPNPVAAAPPPVEAPFPWFLAIVVTLVVLGLGGFLLAGGLRRRLRRKGRRTGDPRQQVVGAWAEMLDQLDEADLRSLEPLSGPEVAAVAAEHFGPEVGAPVAGIATLSTPAVYSSAEIDDVSATEAWQNLEAARVALRRKLTSRQRFKAMVRSLRRRN